MSIDLVLERPLRTQSVIGSLSYLEPQAEKPWVAFDYAPGGRGETNATYSARQVAIRDLRPSAHMLSLDVHGFELVTRESAVADFDDEEQVTRIGDAEAAELVADATGAGRVIVFDHTVRRRSPESARQPSIRVHNDYTALSGPRRVRDLFGGEAEALLKKRVAFINVWRPIRHAAEDWPLALADARSVAPGDLVATDIVYPDRRGEIYGLNWSPRHRWWFAPAMQTDEALLIKCYDSRTDVARFTPHTAFADPRTPPDAPPRESIEYRTIAFFD